MIPFKKNKQPARKRGNYAFIDSQNLNRGTQKMGWKMDWKKFREFLRDNYGVEKAFMFLGYKPDFSDLYEQLHSQGYLVVLKPTLEMFNEPKVEGEEEDPDEEKKVTKGNVDADLVLHVMKEKNNYDKAVIVSGDGDFYSLIELLEQENKLLKVLTPNWQYSSLLKPFEAYIERLDQKRSELRYPDYRHKTKNRGTDEKSSHRKKQHTS
jgi:uncharacterized LabA/DUF88 family protein